VSPPDIVDIATRAVDRLELSPAAKQELKGIQAELLAGYQDSFVAMVTAIEKQASALERLQNTLAILIEAIDPKFAGRIPAAVRAVAPGEMADVASAVVLADPIAAGYTLTQTRIAEALGIGSGDVSVLIQPFGILTDGECAVTVRKGKKQDQINYHPRAIERFRNGVANPPAKLTKNQRLALERVRKRLILDGQ